VPKPSYRVGRSSAGLGLFALKPYKKRAYVVAYRGRRISNAEAEKLELRDARYMFEINSRWTINGSSRWNKARYVNHSCRPNVEAIQRGHAIVYKARRKIAPGDEITVDYGKDYFESYITRSRCRCVKCKERRNARQKELRQKQKRAERKRARARKLRRS
jgi:uncharacterized protein